jgi:D-alanyl-lipoteichoic acid acyltransferase DltB (MBOAT superfamily)
MLFNSYPFLLAFLPITLGVAMLLNVRAPRNVYLAWLVLASFVFYGWEDPSLVALMAGSIAGNYVCGHALVDPARRGRKLILALGVIGNLVLIGYYKYAGFAMQNLAAVWPGEWTIPRIALPLGISFYTFQQIAYLVDAYRGEVRRHNLLNYSLFVVFFPQLVAGPIVHHRDILDQFSRRAPFSLTSSNLAVGMTIFTIGLAKKVLFADAFAPFASAVFRAAERGNDVSLLEAWVGMFCYAFQLYFDFSGYSDMAIGLARMFAIRLPLNFDSPYKAVDIIDFWRRWHMTLSQFLRDYLYIPLGGSRCGPARRHVNLLATMLLGGLWHGAGWTFVLWGGVHGVMLITNHVWRAARPPRLSDGVVARGVSRAMTFVCVCLAWILFRAESLAGAGRIYAALCGVGSAHAWGSDAWQTEFLKPEHAALWVLAGMLIVWGLPNTQEIMGRVRPALRFRHRLARPATWSERLTASLQWRPSPIVAAWYAALFVAAFCSLAELSEFIYFHF